MRRLQQSNHALFPYCDLVIIAESLVFLHNSSSWKFTQVSFNKQLKYQFSFNNFFLLGIKNRNTIQEEKEAQVAFVQETRVSDDKEKV